ncbi:hypothetical protein CHKEEEPN_3286 [Methylorubrum podarium]|nr:hypothetical protein CHKEEEPN_3286 [Methylorubrum podarium]
MSFVGSGWTWYCFSKPPMPSTPATPGTVLIWGRMIQSCTVRRYAARSSSVLSRWPSGVR